MFYLTTWLEPLSGEEIFGWRMLLTWPAMAIFMVITGQQALVKALWLRLRHEPILWLAMPVSAALLGVQLWLFLWAPLHGHALDVSLGYFMLPLTIVLISAVVFKEKLSLFKKVATGLAALGVLNALVQAGGFSWPTLLVCLGYPYYFVLRRRVKTEHLGGLWFDMLLLLPLAGGFVLMGGHVGWAVFEQNPGLLGFVPLLGLCSAVALIAYILSSKLLPFALFGLMGYVEPVLLVLVALLLGERIAPNEWLTYIPIWLALLVLAAEGFSHVRRQKLTKNRG